VAKIDQHSALDDISGLNEKVGEGLGSIGFDQVAWIY
jgi:hypothetical protein